MFALPSMEVETSVPEPAVQPRGKWRRVAVAAGAFVTVLYALTTLGHWNATLPQGTDSTWLRQLHELFRTDAIFGRDVIWTFGPYGFLYAFTTPATAMYVLIGRAFLAISCGLALWTI